MPVPPALELVSKPRRLLVVFATLLIVLGLAAIVFGVYEFVWAYGLPPVKGIRAHFQKRGAAAALLGFIICLVGIYLTLRGDHESPNDSLIANS